MITGTLSGFIQAHGQKSHNFLPFAQPTLPAPPIKATQVDNFEPRLFGWQISSFYDLNPTDQAIYNALVTASDDGQNADDSFLVTLVMLSDLVAVPGSST